MLAARDPVSRLGYLRIARRQLLTDGRCGAVKEGFADRVVLM